MCDISPELGLFVPDAVSCEVDLREAVMEFFMNTSQAESENNRARFDADFASAMTILLHPDSVAANLHEFVLSVDPAQDMAMLSNPETLRHAFTLSISDSVIFAGGGKLSAVFDCELTVDLMLIPCRMQGVMSYGIVGRRLYGSHASCTENRHVVIHDIAYGRFIRNEETGESLILTRSDDDSMDLPAVQMMYMKNLNTRERILMKTFFEKESFSVGDFSSAVRRHIAGVQTRFCPICNCSPKRSCSCVLPHRKPLHATDFSSFVSNAEFMKGDFLGDFDFFVSCPKIGSFGSTKVMSRVSCKTPMNASIPFCLHSTLLQKMMAATSPTRTTMPSQYEGFLPVPEMQDFFGAMSDPLLSSYMERLDGTDFRNFFKPPPAQPIVVKLPQDTITSPILGVDLSSSSSSSSDKALSFLSHVEQGENMSGSVDSTEVNSMLALSMSDSRTAVSEDLPFLPSSDDIMLPANDLVRDGDVTAFGADMELSLMDSECTLMQAAETPASALSSSNIRLQEFVTEAAADPADTSATLSTDQGLKQEVLTPEELAIEAKKEQRKQKNRAAAARSNAARKVRNENLRKNLAYIRERVQVLRVTEAVLREENEALKEQVETMSIS